MAWIAGAHSGRDSLLSCVGILHWKDVDEMSQPNQYLYIAKGATVFRGLAFVCKAASSMKARLIAKALNYFTQRAEGRHD